MPKPLPRKRWKSGARISLRARRLKPERICNRMRLPTAIFFAATISAYAQGNGVWLDRAPIPVARQEMATAGFNGKIYVLGGIFSGFQSTDRVDVFDPTTDSWSSIHPLPSAANHNAAAVAAGKLYSINGSVTHVYQPATDSWVQVASTNSGHGGTPAVGMIDDKIYIAGGAGADIASTALEAYDPATNTWRTLPPMPDARHGFWASTLGNKIYLPGGADAVAFGSPTDYNTIFTLDTSIRGFDNISTRALVETGDNVLIGGFIVSGGNSKRVLVRAPGPSLPVPGALPDTTLELYDAGGNLLIANDNWQDAPNRQEIIDSTLAPTDPREAAILTQVPGGGTTAIVRGANGTTGVALVEVYDLDAASPAKLANISTRGVVRTDN